jgi:hypothetical protein
MRGSAIKRKIRADVRGAGRRGAGAPPAEARPRKDAVQRVTVSGLDRRAAESLYLELKRFCRTEGAELVRFAVREYRGKR